MKLTSLNEKMRFPGSSVGYKAWFTVYMSDGPFRLAYPEVRNSHIWGFNDLRLGWPMMDIRQHLPDECLL